MTIAAFATLFGSLVVSTVFLLAVVALVWWFDRYDREPIHLVIMVFLWGASAAPAIAIFAFGIFDQVAAHWIPAESIGFVGLSIFGPFAEECAKGLGVLLVVLFTSKFDNPTDGVVYGTAVGLGFAVTENVVYGLGTGLQMTDIQTPLLLVFGRTLLSAGIHAVSSAVFGGFVGHAVMTGKATVRIAWTLCGLACAVLLHASFNVALMMVGPFSPDGSLRGWLIAIPSLYLGYGLVLALFLKSEHGILKKQLAEEVSLHTVPEWVADVIPYYRRRIRSDWWESRSERAVISRLLTRIAFRKHALRHLPAEEAALASLEVVRLRQRLRDILGIVPVEND